MTETPDQQDKEYLLRCVREHTAKIQRLQDEIVDVGQRRRTHVLNLRKQNVTYKQIAESMNVSEVTVYKIIVGK